MGRVASIGYLREPFFSQGNPNISVFLLYGLDTYMGIVRERSLATRLHCTVWQRLKRESSNVTDALSPLSVMNAMHIFVTIVIAVRLRHGSVRADALS